MSFDQINIQQQYFDKTIVNDLATEFDLQKFNQNFEDMNIMEQINSLSDKITFDSDKPCCDQKCSNKTRPDTSKQKYRLIDPELAKDHNYLNPYEENYVNPYQDSLNRMSLLVLINKFTKKLLVIGLNQNQPNDIAFRYYIPGGRCKIFESFRDASFRLFKQHTGIELDTSKLTTLLFAKVRNPEHIKYMQNPLKEHHQKENIPPPYLEVCTFIGFIFDEKTYKFMKHRNCRWMCIKKLQYYPDTIFHYYYKYLYSAMIPYLY